jgi:hypothetical protein
VTPSGIEPATFRFVAQCLNHCATAHSKRVLFIFIAMITLYATLTLQNLTKMVTLTATISFHCRLPYVEAVLSELFRVCSVAPVTPPHRVTKDTTLKGYFIPKVCIFGNVLSDTCSLANHLHLHYQGDGDGVGLLNVGFYSSCDAAVCSRSLYRCGKFKAYMANLSLVFRNCFAEVHRSCSCRVQSCTLNTFMSA